MAVSDSLRAMFNPENKDENKGNNTFTKFYPFWKMEAGETAVVRFVEDSNPDNPRKFLVENFTHAIMVNGKKRVVACLEMYGEKCPLCEKSREYYQKARDAGEPKADTTKGIPAGPLTQLGKKYYRKKDYLGQVIVQSNPEGVALEFEEGHEVEVPISFGPQIYKNIQAGFMSGDLDADPYLLEGGYDFRIRKTKNGENASYTTSSFAPKQTNVDKDVVAKLNPYDLNSLRTKKSDLSVIEALLIASENGGEAEAEYSSDSVESAVTGEAASSGSNDSRVADILAQIRGKNAAQEG